MDFGFIKLRVAGSDLLLLEEMGDGKGRDKAGFARAILDRRRGVGALRLVALARAERDIWLEVYDRDGSRNAALFDAALCAGRWLLDSGRAGGETLHFRTRSGEIQVDVLDGSSLGISLGPLLGLPDRRILDEDSALEKRLRVEAKGERFDALPVALPATRAVVERGASGEPPETATASRDEGPAAVVFFHEGGEGPLRVRLSSHRRGGVPAVAIPARCLSESEMRIGNPRDARVDTVSMAAMALGAASLLHFASNEALVRSGDGGLWVRRNTEGSLYVAGRPAYVFRGEFHLDEDGEIG